MTGPPCIADDPNTTRNCPYSLYCLVCDLPDRPTGLCGNQHPAGGWLCHEPVGHEGFHWSNGPGTEAW